METSIAFSVVDWMKKREYSSYHAYVLPDTEPRPGNASRRGNAWVPRSPDGFTLGNKHVFAAIGVPPMEAERINEFYTSPRNDVSFIDELDFSSMTLLVGPDKAATHLHSPPATYKVQAFHACFVAGGKDVDTWFKDARKQEARRIKHTAITTSFSAAVDLSLSTINFAPLLPEEPVVYRILSVKNDSPMVLHDLALDITFENRASSWSWSIDVERKQLAITEQRENTSFLVRMIPIDDAVHVEAFACEEKPVSVPGPLDRCDRRDGDGAGFILLRTFIGKLQPWAEKVVIMACYPVLPPAGPVSSPESLNASGIIDSLARTERAWNAVSTSTHLASSSVRLEDLYDSIITMGLCHVGNKGIHAGSVYYSHGRAWTRDNYWIQKALHHVGYHDAAVHNCKFFLDAWLHNGGRFANSYGLNSYSVSNPGNEVLVELPWYFILMVTEAIKWAPLAAEQLPKEHVAGLVRAALTESKFHPGFLFPLNSDETWIWACDVAETGFVLDNAVLALAALVAMRRWLRDILDEETLRAADSLASNIHASIKHHFIVPIKNRLAVAIDDNGTHDESAITIPLSMPFIHDVIDEYPDLIVPATNGLTTCWQACRVPLEGGGSIVRSHSATTALTGNAPGHFLEAIGAVNARKVGDEMLDGIMNFVNATGVVNELHDVFDPSWGTEHRRLWDSMSVLQGVIQYLVGTRVRPGSVAFRPYCPAQVESVSFDGLVVRGRAFSFRMARKNGRLLCAVKLDGVEIARYDGLHDVQVDTVTGRVEVTPVDDAAGSSIVDRPTGEYWGKIIPAACDDGISHPTAAIVCDDRSTYHACEVNRQLAFTLGRTLRTITAHEASSIAGKLDHIIWISTDVPFLIQEAIMFKDMLDEFAGRDYNIVAFDHRAPKRTICWIPNKGHVYNDTNRFIQDMRLHVLPRRQKPMNMHPHGFLRLSDLVGSPIDELVRVTITSTLLGDAGKGEPVDSGTRDLHLFGQGEAVGVLPGGIGRWEGTIAPRSNPRAVPKRETYLLLTAISPYAPFDLAAAGIATGANAVQLGFQCDARVPLEIEITLHLPQSWHPQNLRSPQWERIDDPIRYTKQPGGEKELHLKLHPGRPVGRHMKTRLPQTCRHLTFVFVKYPRTD